MFRCCKSTCPSSRRLTDVRAQVGEAAAQAKEIIVPIALDAKDRLLPLALDARDRLVPLAEAAADKARPLALDAKERLTPLAEVAIEKARPLALDARERLVPLAEVAIEKARPLAEQARGKAADVVEAEIIPRLVELREQAEPLMEHGPALAAAALVGETLEPEAEPKKRRHPIRKLFLLATLGAVAWLVAKTLLGSRDDGWELQETDLDDTEDVPDETLSADDASASAKTVARDAKPEPADYGEGSYRGENPPEDFNIKGNERSMKYHVPKAIGYERTVTDLWFNSPEAAERAGFTRALR
jgi:hypothetical protein